MSLLRRLILITLSLLAAFWFTPEVWAFCGFYVAKADANLYNQASQVAIARQGNHTVLTMANDYKGDAQDFALVVPVPVVLQEQDVKVANPKIMARLDAFSAPRLVEYFDEDPCLMNQRLSEGMPMPSAAGAMRDEVRRQKNSLGVTVEAQFTVGEYDILILSAKESGGLETWLRQNGYQLPRDARRLLRPYIRQQMKFFVAKVNLKEYDKAGFQSLRPLQITYDSPRFMLPIRLGMTNAESAQDLLIYLLTPQGQVETTNYRTVKVPSNTQIPVFVKDKFSDFYRAMFRTSYEREDRRVAFLEYAWDMSSCDPCAADPLSREEMQEAGVFWLDGSKPAAGPTGIAPRRRPPQAGVFITRLHVRYTRDKFPEDLMFQETGNRQLFQGRYVLRHPFTGEATCPAAKDYQRQLPKRFEQEAQTLARLTGWNINEIRQQMPKAPLISQSWLDRMRRLMRGE